MAKSRISEKISETNKKRILYYLFKNYNTFTTRTNISKDLNISFPAVSNNVAQLIEEGFILEELDTSSSLGRRSKKIFLNPDSKITIVVHIEYQNANIFFLDNHQNNLRHKKMTFERNIKFHDLWKLLENEIKTILGDLLSENQCEVLGICVAIPTPIDKKNKKIIKSRFYGWKDEPIYEYITLEDKKIPVFWENDANLLAKGFYESNSRYDNVLAIYFSMGIGMGIIINGDLYTGKEGNAGEIGQLKVEYKGEYEELEKIISERSLIEFAKNKLNLTYEDSEQILVELERNNQLSIVNKEFEYISKKIADVFAPVIMVLDPEIVIFNGTVTRSCPSLTENIVNKLEKLIEKNGIFEINREENLLIIKGSFWEVLDNVLGF
ncbi:MAG TPA: ROK family protein, partial [Defluviitoga tunisiensis]|nr:ROK family protein [Defluviitoga tunisiensis]